MGMTIDEHIAQLKKLKSFHNGSYGASINFTIDTMRKYQKIQEIMNELNGDFYGSYLKDRQALEKIYEEVENGNDD